MLVIRTIRLESLHRLSKREVGVCGFSATFMRTVSELSNASCFKTETEACSEAASSSLKCSASSSKAEDPEGKNYNQYRLFPTAQKTSVQRLDKSPRTFSDSLMDVGQNGLQSLIHNRAKLHAPRLRSGRAARAPRCRQDASAPANCNASSPSVDTWRRPTVNDDKMSPLD